MRLIKLVGTFSFIILFLFPAAVAAAGKNFVTPIFPVRGREFWRQGKDNNQLQQLQTLVTKYSLPSTWLLHYDILADQVIVDLLKTNDQRLKTEYGLFLEVTRKLAEDSFVKYDWEHGNWSDANKVFLSGYTRDQRQRMIDKVFTAFKDEFGFFPASYGAWYVDVWSMEYIRDKYGADIVLGLADQYSTDGYKEWGQYLNLPYFVSVKSAIEPAADKADSTRILKVQWAPRHPLLGFGPTVEFSNFSAQVNDYHRQKGLGQDYFRKLLDDIVIRVPGQIAQAVIGIEAGELEDQYFPELEAQFKTLAGLESSKQITNVTLKQFNDEYRKLFPSVSPPATLSSTVGSETITWTMTPQYRLGVKVSNGKTTPVDLRYYHLSVYRDNDQLYPDFRQVLIREAPAASPSMNIAVPQTRPLKSGHTVYGGYVGRWPKLKSLLVKLAGKTPDVVYSSLDGQKYIGLRTGFESMIGIRLPWLKFAKFDFKFPILENFLSLRQKLTPDFAWEGKQEIEQP